MNYSTIIWQVDAGLLRLTLNRLAQLNAFTVDMANELEHAFNRANEDDDVRVVLVTGPLAQHASRCKPA
jgi:enoyl-CoA hydratase/carnithine racemase